MSNKFPCSSDLSIVCKRIRRSFLLAQPTYALFSIRSTFPLASQALYLVSTCLEVPRDLIKRRTSRISMVGARRAWTLRFSQSRSLADRHRAVVFCCTPIKLAAWGRNSPRPFSENGWLKTIQSMVQLWPVHQEVTCCRARVAAPNEGEFPVCVPGESGIQLQLHPMIIHAYFARNLLLMTYDFSQEFSGPLYEWVSISNPPLDRWKYLLTQSCGNLRIQSSTIEVSKRLHGESTNLPSFFATDPTSPYWLWRSWCHTWAYE